MFVLPSRPFAVNGSGIVHPAASSAEASAFSSVQTSAPVSAGVFTVDPKGTGSLRVPPLPGVSRVDVFAVTLEPEGGAPAPTGAMYLAGKAA